MKLMVTVSPDEDRAIRDAAQAEGRTISDFLRQRIFGNAASPIGGDDRLAEIAALQRVSISILARFWGEHNADASKIIREMAERAGAKI